MKEPKTFTNLLPIASNDELTELYWSVNTPELLQEIGCNNETAALRKPLHIFGLLLFELGTIAAEINDDRLNAIMCRLCIYEISDPYNKAYNKELRDAIVAKGQVTFKK